MFAEYIILEVLGRRVPFLFLYAIQDFLGFLVLVWNKVTKKEVQEYFPVYISTHN